MSPLQPRRRGARLSLLLAAALLLAEPAVGARAGVDPATAEIVDLLRPDAALRAGAAPHGRAMAGALREVEVTVDRFATRYQVDYLRALSFPVFFTRDGGALTPESRGQLRALGEALKAPELAGERFLVAGHADAGTHEARNIELSYARARAVRDYLVDAFGIDPRRLVIAGWGSSRRLEGYPPRSGIHRRVEIALVTRAGAPQPAGRYLRGPDDRTVAVLDAVGDPSAFEAGLRALAVRPAPEGCVQPTHDLDDFQPGGPIVGCIPLRAGR
ncbi:MAG TPA: OmpA family protein [Salinarimonas sp.]|nr:OmpA family protein [Salinarimonas sp.]